MTQRSVEVVIGRLMADEEFRQGFLADPRDALARLGADGTDLTDAEVAFLIATDPSLWEHAADHLDPRLQKASLKS